MYIYYVENLMQNCIDIKYSHLIINFTNKKYDLIFILALNITLHQKYKSIFSPSCINEENEFK